MDASCTTDDTLFDFNGDGFDDLIVGAPLADDGGIESGSAYVYFGSTSPSSTMNASDADIQLIGADAGDRFGISVASAGDVNNDGFDDFIVGAPLADDGGETSGSAYVFFGSTSPSSTMDASDAGMQLIGGDAHDRFGRSVASAGDVNNDGLGDIIVGAHGADDGGADSGSAYVFFGSTSPSSTMD
ncbi:MAG: hypothetical protein GY802_05435, partial [Gammaproteobacteria bacterium]|nr:hypothetical protein [Gammaproteobacteria bacterium]